MQTLGTGSEFTKHGSAKLGTSVVWHVQPVVLKRVLKPVHLLLGDLGKMVANKVKKDGAAAICQHLVT